MKGCKAMQHKCRITVLETKCFPDLQEKYLADPKSGPCPFFKPGDTFLLKRTPQQDDFYHLMNGKFCGEAWDAVSRYVYTALQGGSIMKGWTNDDGLTVKATRLTDTVVAPIFHEIGCDQEMPSVATLGRIHMYENQRPVPFVAGHGRAILLPQGADQRRKEAAVFSRGGITQYLSSTFRAADWLVFR